MRGKVALFALLHFIAAEVISFTPMTSVNIKNQKPSYKSLPKTPDKFMQQPIFTGNINEITTTGSPFIEIDVVELKIDKQINRVIHKLDTQVSERVNHSFWP